MRMGALIHPSTVVSGQTDNLALEVNAHDALVVINTRGFEPACQSPFALPDTRKRTNGEVSAESVPFTNRRVEALLQLELVPDIRPPRALQYIVAGICELVHGSDQAVRFTRTGLKFASHAQKAHLVHLHIT